MLSKKPELYRYNPHIKSYQYFDYRLPSWGVDAWVKVEEQLVPEEIKQRAGALVKKCTTKKKRENQSFEESPSITSNIPCNYVYKAISKYLNFHNLPNYTSRLKHVDRFFDGKTRFSDIRVFDQTESTQCDNHIITGWFDEYLSHYMSEFTRNKGKKSGTHKQKDKDIYDILNLIAYYLLASDEAKSATISKNAEKQYNHRMTFPESRLKDADIDDNFSLDNLFKSVNEFDNWLHKAHYIPKKRNKKGTVSWEKLNCLRTPYKQLTDEQKEIHDNMTAIQELVKANRDNLDRGTLYKLNKVIGDLRYKLGTLVQSPNVGRSSGERINRFDTAEHQEHLGNAILDNLDYTNPDHIKGLIENYHDLHNKYHNQPDSPVYTILTEFNKYVSNLELSPNHRLILMAFMNKSSNKKEVADFLESFLNISTEKMMRTIKTSISKKISKYFEKHVGK